jgi:hypothetical protein
VKVGDLVKVRDNGSWIAGQIGIIVFIDTSAGRPVHGTVLMSGDKKWFDLDELELVE